MMNVFSNWVPNEIPGTNGILRFYSLFILLGIIVSILASWIKLKRREIPTEPFEWSIFLIVPSAIFGSSIIGKINSPVIDQYGFWGYFMIWEPGLAVHGGVIVGVIVGYFWFRHYSKKYEISLWIFADAIIPNILLGQVIGRWGNFFNHELLGQITTSLNWLPDWLLENLRKANADGSSAEGIDIVRHPLFLYESLVNLFSWVLITFVIPKIGMWNSVKPWKKYPKKFVPLWEKDVELLESEKNWATPFKKLYYYRLWKLNCWNQAYFEQTPSKIKKLTVVRKYPEPHLKANNPFFRLMERWFKNQWIRIKQLWTQDAKPLEKNANPDKYWMTRVGVQAGSYVVIYSMVRIILEMFRDESDILFPYDYVGTYIFLGIGVIIGIILLIFAQIISVHKWRQIRWLYEKQY